MTYPFTPLLQSAITEIIDSWTAKTTAAEVNKITEPLYHYTDVGALHGIIKHQELWFTSIYHLNDPTELSHGIDLALQALRSLTTSSDDVTKFFAEQMQDALVNGIGEEFSFFVSSLSRCRDDLGQWRAYGDNGRGIALGLAPHLFHGVPCTPDTKPSEKVFVSSVLYGDTVTRQKQEDELALAIDIINRPLVRSEFMKDKGLGLAFLKEISVQIAVPLLWNSMTAKHQAYVNEQEIRLIIIGRKDDLGPCTDFRTRKSDLVPFTRSPFPIRVKGSIAEVVIGPSASETAEDGVWSLLHSLGIDPTRLIAHSDIPYRAA